MGVAGARYSCREGTSVVEGRAYACMPKCPRSQLVERWSGTVVHEVLLAEALGIHNASRTQHRWFHAEHRADLCKRYEWIPTATTVVDGLAPAAAAAAPFVAHAGKVFDLKHLPTWPQVPDAERSDKAVNNASVDESKAAPSDAATPRRRWITPRVLVGALPHAASEWCELLRAGITTVLDVSVLGPVGVRREGYMSALIDALAAVGTKGAPAGIEVLHMPLPRVPGTAPWIDEVFRSRAVTSRPARTVQDCLRVLQQRLVGATKVCCRTVPLRHSVPFCSGTERCCGMPFGSPPSLTALHVSRQVFVGCGTGGARCSASFGCALGPAATTGCPHGVCVVCRGNPGMVCDEWDELPPARRSEIVFHFVPIKHQLSVPVACMDRPRMRDAECTRTHAIDAAFGADRAPTAVQESAEECGGVRKGRGATSASTPR